jgi:hypothetical protein
MDARSVLLAHIRAAHDDVLAGRALLQSPQVTGPRTRAALDLIHRAFQDRNRQLDEIERDVSADADLAECWGRLQSVCTGIQKSSRDSLALLGGLFVQQSGLDDGYAGVVDGLLAELAAAMPGDVHWPSVAIAVGDAFSPLTGTIWTRYPEFTVWALPMVGHEAGHVAVQEIKVLTPDATRYTFPLTALAAARGPAQAADGSGDRLVRELCADFFGTWTMGAAYACSAVLLRFRPRHADVPIAHHPPERARVHLISRTLDRLDAGYGDVLELLDRRWADMLQSVDLTPLGDVAAKEVDGLVDVLVDQAGQYFSDAAFTGRKRASALVGPLEQGTVGVPPVAGPSPLRDVVNAAWVARLRRWEEPDEVQRVGTAAMDACRAILAARSGGDRT